MEQLFPKKVNDPLVLVTGAAGGIGSAVARKLAASGFRVAVHFHSSEADALSLTEELRRMGAQAECFGADLSLPDEVRRMFRAVRQTMGEPDSLVNNAGIAMQKLVTDMTDADWQSVIGADLSGTFYCCREALPAMLRAHEGQIVNIASMWGEVGASMEVAYSAAKAGVIGLTKALAKEVGLSGIRVNAVSPGVIETEMMASFSKEEKFSLREETPLFRLGTPEDVAEAVCFLLSEKAAFITGQTISVNGGFVV